MAAAELVSAWLVPFIAPIILYYAKQAAIHRGWLDGPPDPSEDIHRQTLDVLKDVRQVLWDIDDNIIGHRQELVVSLKGIKGNMDRLKELSEAREKDGGMLIYQRIPTPHVTSAAGHLDG